MTMETFLILFVIGGCTVILGIRLIDIEDKLDEILRRLKSDSNQKD